MAKRQGKQLSNDQAIKAINDDAIAPFNYGRLVDVWKIFDDLTNGKRKPEDLSDEERRAVLDTRHIDGLPPSTSLKRAIGKLRVASLNRDQDSVRRTDSAISTEGNELLKWTEYVQDGEGRKKGRHQGGINSGTKRRADAAKRNQQIVSYARMLMSGHDRGEWAKLAAKYHECSVVTARKAIREGGLYEKRQEKIRTKSQKKR